REAEEVLAQLLLVQPLSPARSESGKQLLVELASEGDMPITLEGDPGRTITVPRGEPVLSDFALNRRHDRSCGRRGREQRTQPHCLDHHPSVQGWRAPKAGDKSSPPPSRAGRQRALPLPSRSAEMDSLFSDAIYPIPRRHAKQGAGPLRLLGSVRQGDPGKR